MTLEEQIHQEANNQIEEIKSVFPYLRENELKFITSCLRSAYIKGAMDALDKQNKTIKYNERNILNRRRKERD